MRRSGKTTRSIDLAIQKLFEFGKIYIPSKTELEEGKNIRKIIEYCQIDTDADKGSAQRDFKLRLLDRIKLEHRDQVVIDSNWIKLIDENNR